VILLDNSKFSIQTYGYENTCSFPEPPVPLRITSQHQPFTGPGVTLLFGEVVKEMVFLKPQWPSLWALKGVCDKTLTKLEDQGSRQVQDPQRQASLLCVCQQNASELCEISQDAHVLFS
jgi:hypothetical protein